MPNKRNPTDTSEAQSSKKTRINGLRKDYKLLPWVESSFQKQSPELDYFSFAELFNGTKDATNSNYMDLLLTLQSKQSSKASNIAHAAQTTFATRRLQSAFGDKYSKYWTNRKDNELRENVDEESRSTISSIQQLVHQNLLERANNVFGTSLSSHSSSSNASFSNASSSNTSSSNTSSSNTSSSNTSSSDVAFSDNTSYDANGLRKVLSQSMELASDCLARLRVIDLASNSAKDILKACTTEDYYRRIINATNPKEPEISNDAKVLITAIKELRVLSCKSLRNTLYQNGYKLNHNPINDSDIGLVENLVKHFLDLIEFPKNPLSNTILGGFNRSERLNFRFLNFLIINF